MLVEFECLRRGAALVQIEVRPFPAYQPYRPAVVSLIKECGGVVRQGFDVATRPFGVNGEISPVSAMLVRNGVAVAHMPDVINSMSVVQVYWALRTRSLGPPDAARLECTGGIVNSSLPQAVILGIGDGLVSGRQEMHLPCAKAGAANCVLNLEWALYQGVAIPFRKICGGRREGVQVIADEVHDRSVLLQGTKPKRAREDEGWDLNPLVSVSPEEDNTTFTISLARSLAPGEDALRLAPPQLSVFNPHVVRAYITGSLMRGGVVASRGAAVRVNFQCLRSGSSRVEVTLPVAGSAKFKPITFSFTKRCVVVHYWQQWWVTILLIFCLVFCCSCTFMLVIVMQHQAKLKQKVQGEENAEDAELEQS